MIDLDSLAWWGDVAHKFVTSFGVIGLAIWHWILWLKDKEEAVKWVEHHIERRHNMSISISDIIKDAELAKQVLPELEAWWTATSALIQKVEALKASTATAEGAPPTGQV